MDRLIYKWIDDYMEVWRSREMIQEKKGKKRKLGRRMDSRQIRGESGKREKCKEGVW